MSKSCSPGKLIRYFSKIFTTVNKPLWIFGVYFEFRYQRVFLIHLKGFFSPLKVFLFFVIGLTLTSSVAPNQITPVFKPGEEIRYRVHYGFLNAGHATMRVTDKYYMVNNRVCFRAEITGNSSGAVDAMYRIRNTWGCYFDTINYQPQKAFRSIAENKYRKREETYFDYARNVASIRAENDTPETVKITQRIQDMVGGYYFLRLLSYENRRIGDTIRIPAIFESETYDFKILYLGKQKIKTKKGRINSFLLSPVMPDNKLFSGKHPIKMWISDDLNRIPLKVEAEMLVGSVDLDIEEFSNLKYPIYFEK